MDSSILPPLWSVAVSWQLTPGDEGVTEEPASKDLEVPAFTASEARQTAEDRMRAVVPPGRELASLEIGEPVLMP